MLQETTQNHINNNENNRHGHSNRIQMLPDLWMQGGHNYWKYLG